MVEPMRVALARHRASLVSRGSVGPPGQPSPDYAGAFMSLMIHDSSKLARVPVYRPACLSASMASWSFARWYSNQSFLGREPHLPGPEASTLALGGTGALFGAGFFCGAGAAGDAA